MSRRDRIEELLMKEFTPLSLDVEDESRNHLVPENAQTHYKIVMVASVFENQTRINRHRLVNALLKNEFDTGMHALSMHLYTPKEWESKTQDLPQSPNCKGGYKK